MSKEKAYYYDIQHNDSRTVVMVTILAKNQKEAREQVARLFGPQWTIARQIKTLPYVYRKTS